MAEAVGTTIDGGGGGVSQPPGNVSLDVAIAYINDFVANAAMVEIAFAMMQAIALSTGTQLAQNNARMGAIEAKIASLPKPVCNCRCKRDDIHRSLSGGGGSTSGDASTSVSFDGGTE